MKILLRQFTHLKILSLKTEMIKKFIDLEVLVIVNKNYERN